MNKKFEIGKNPYSIDKHNKEEIVETIMVLCDYLDQENLELVWIKAYELAQMQVVKNHTPTISES